MRRTRAGDTRTHLGLASLDPCRWPTSNCRPKGLDAFRAQLDLIIAGGLPRSSRIAAQVGQADRGTGFNVGWLLLGYHEGRLGGASPLPARTDCACFVARAALNGKLVRGDYWNTRKPSRRA